MLKVPEKPKPPAFKPSRNRCLIVASSSPVGVYSGSRAASLPITNARNGEYGISEAALTPSSPLPRLFRNSGKVTQSHRIPACMHESGIDSVRSILRIAPSRSSGLTWAKPKPHLPFAPVATPYHTYTHPYASPLDPP